MGIERVLSCYSIFQRVALIERFACAFINAARFSPFIAALFIQGISQLHQPVAQLQQALLKVQCAHSRKIAATF